MKTINSIRQYLPVVFFSIALMAASVEVSAQKNRNNNKSDKKYDRKEYKNDHSNRNDQSSARYEKRDRDGDHYKRQYSGRDNDNYQYSQRYSKHQNYSNHPKYGRVYQRFDRNPVVFRHSQGNYYYSGNNFYNYRRGVGYYVVEPPRNVYFRDLPFRCETVYSHGHEYYRNGDLFFSYSPRGYVIVPSPIGINLSVRF